MASTWLIGSWRWYLLIQLFLENVSCPQVSSRHIVTGAILLDAIYPLLLQLILLLILLLL